MGLYRLELENLFEVIGIRNLLAVVKGKKMVYDGKNMLIDFSRESPVNPSRIVELSRKKMAGIKLTPDFKTQRLHAGSQGKRYHKAGKGTAEVTGQLMNVSLKIILAVAHKFLSPYFLTRKFDAAKAVRCRLAESCFAFFLPY